MALPPYRQLAYAPDATVYDGAHWQGYQRNRQDIITFLVEVAGEEVLAARLAEYGMVAAEFRNLASRSLRRRVGVLGTFSSRSRDLVGGIQRATSLPLGQGYYADQIRRWRDDPAWDMQITAAAVAVLLE